MNPTSLTCPRNGRVTPDELRAHLIQQQHLRILRQVAALTGDDTAAGVWALARAEEGMSGGARDLAWLLRMDEYAVKVAEYIIENVRAIEPGDLREGEALLQRPEIRDIVYARFGNRLSGGRQP